jgi:hypothetical protein
MTYDDLMKQRGGPLGVEQRQAKLAANGEAIERWQRKLFRAANELQKLAAQRKRLLRGPSDITRSARFRAALRNHDRMIRKFNGDHPLTGCGGGAIEGDSLEGI